MVEYGKEYFYIGLFEKHPCSDKEELVKKENEYIRSLKPSMNKIGYVTCRKKNYDREYSRGYYLNNKTCRNLYGREYYHNNKEIVACECGCVITNRGLKQHIATKKHQIPMA